MDCLFGVLLVVSQVVSTAAFACSSYGTTMYDTKCQNHVNGQRCSYGHPYWYNPVCDYDGCNNRPCVGGGGHGPTANGYCNGTIVGGVAVGFWLSSCRTPYHGNVIIVNGGSQCVWTDPYGDSYECPEPAACVAGTYSKDGKNAGGDKACQHCPPGKFQTSTGASTCSGSLCAVGKYGQTGATSAAAATCATCPAGTYSAAAGASVCTEEEALGTCGSALYDFFSGLESSCPKDSATQMLNRTSCGTPTCQSFLSNITDYKFASVIAGLKVCAAEPQNPYHDLKGWLEHFTDELIRNYYAKSCGFWPPRPADVNETLKSETVKLTPPSPDTCYGASVVIETLKASCPADPVTWKHSPTSCGISACASFLSTLDDRKFKLVKTGLEACGLARPANTYPFLRPDSFASYVPYKDYLPGWNDMFIRVNYAQACGLLRYVKLTPPSPDTCYGAAVVIDKLTDSCPADPATKKHSPTSCGNRACASFLSNITDRTFNLVKTGLEACLKEPASSAYAFYQNWRPAPDNTYIGPKWTDELIRMVYAKGCFGSSRYVYEHIYDGCPRGYIWGHNGMLMQHGSKVTYGGFCASDDNCDVASCQAACDRDSACSAFEINGCTSKPGTCGGQCWLSWLQGDTIRNSPDCDLSGNQRTYRKFEVDIAVKLTPPSPDTCYGAAVVIETLNASCPGDPTWGGARHMYSCGAHVRGGLCPSFISTFDDRKFSLVKAGLQACAADDASPYAGYRTWLPQWNDALIRGYAKSCSLPYGTVKLTPPDGCYGAAVTIDDLTLSCPGDPAWGNTYSCMNPMCASFISSIDDRKFARVKAGLQACAAENSTYRAYANWLSKWNDETLRKVYEEKCRLPYGTLKLTPPSPDTCYGAVVMIDKLMGACPGPYDPAPYTSYPDTGGRLVSRYMPKWMGSGGSCRNGNCSAYVSAISDTVLAKTKKGLKECKTRQQYTYKLTEWGYNMYVADPYYPYGQWFQPTIGTSWDGYYLRWSYELFSNFVLPGCQLPAATLKLSLPKDTCAGAAPFLKGLVKACPANPRTALRSPATCGKDLCLQMVSSIDDAAISDTKTGISACYDTRMININLIGGGNTWYYAGDWATLSTPVNSAVSNEDRQYALSFENVWDYYFVVEDLIEDCGLKLDPSVMGLTPPLEVCSHEAIARVVRKHREYRMDPEDFDNATCTLEVAAVYYDYSQKHGCRNLWGPSYLCRSGDLPR